MKTLTVFLVGILFFTAKCYSQNSEITTESLNCSVKCVWIPKAVDFGQGIVKLDRDSLREKNISAEMVDKLYQLKFPSWIFRDDKSCLVHIFDYDTKFNEYSLQKGKIKGHYVLKLREINEWPEKGELKKEEISKLNVDCFMWNDYLAIEAPKNYALGAITVYFSKLIIK